MFFRPHWDFSRPPPFRPAGFEDDFVPLIGIARAEFNRLFSSQAEGFLEPKREFGVVISDLGQAFGIQRSRLVFACHIDASLDMVVVVVPGDDGGFADFPGPPADVSQAIFDGAR